MAGAGCLALGQGEGGLDDEEREEQTNHTGAEQVGEEERALVVSLQRTESLVLEGQQAEKPTNLSTKKQYRGQTECQRPASRPNAGGSRRSGGSADPPAEPKRTRSSSMSRARQTTQTGQLCRGVE